MSQCLLPNLIQSREKKPANVYFYRIPSHLFHVTILCIKERFNKLSFVLSNFTAIAFINTTVNSLLNYPNNILSSRLLISNFSTLLSIEKCYNKSFAKLSIQSPLSTRFMFFKIITLAESLLQTKR